MGKDAEHFKDLSRTLCLTFGELCGWPHFLNRLVFTMFGLFSSLHMLGADSLLHK